jgi:hypothetical protein
MPFYDEQDHTPDEALAAGRCPECGKDFAKINPMACLNDHWRVQPKNDRDGEEGLRRQDLLKEYIKTHGHSTTEPTRR